jgi:hypothetical protein
VPSINNSDPLFFLAKGKKEQQKGGISNSSAGFMNRDFVSQASRRGSGFSGSRREAGQGEWWWGVRLPWPRAIQIHKGMMEFPHGAAAVPGVEESAGIRSFVRSFSRAKKTHAC